MARAFSNAFGEGRTIDAQTRDLLAAVDGARVRFDEPLSRYTSLRTGGPAEALAQPDCVDALQALLALCRQRGVPWVVLGSGFNVLVRDGGVRGLVVRLHALRAIEQLSAERVRAEAGASHTSVTRFCAERGLAGLEFAVGIPGTVGGWVAMNAGIGVREMKDALEAVELVAAGGSGARLVPAAELLFRYRAVELPADAVVTAARFCVQPDEPAAIRARMRELMARRRATQPVDQPSFGSVFKNPPGDFAGRLIEAAGLKGARAGGAQISELHANFIVNRDAAQSADALELMRRAREQVAERFGIELEPEVRMLGEDA